MKNLDIVKFLDCTDKGGMERGKSMVIRFNVDMRKFTSFKIGGPADVFVDVRNMKEFKRVVKFACWQRVPLFVLGRGTNILVKDKGIRSIVVRLKEEFEKLSFSGLRVRAGAGSLLNKLLMESSKRGLAGLECLVGIPGTVGGACLINAGTKDGEIGDRILKVTCLTKKGNIKKINKEDMRFSYRYTSLPGQDLIITEVELKLDKDRKENCEQRIRSYMNKRKQSQPLSFPNAGCIFKNPESGLSAGALIEKAGLKGKRIGDVEVSTIHANFIINRGKGTAEEVLKLIDLIKNRVMEKFQVRLKEEITIVGE